jgi:hypothetical protein
MSICSPEPYNSARDLQIALLSLFELETLLVPRARIANVDSTAKCKLVVAFHSSLSILFQVFSL